MLDTFSDQSQADMGALIMAERSRCGRGHPLFVSLQRIPLAVTDEVCEWCKAEQTVIAAQGKDMPDSWGYGRFHFAHPSRKNGRGVGG